VRFALGKKRLVGNMIISPNFTNITGWKINKWKTKYIRKFRHYGLKARVEEI